MQAALLLVLAAGAAVATAAEAPARPSYPGQAFHEWRSRLIADKYTSRADSSSSSGQHDPQQPAHADWVSIVARRETLSTQQPPATHTATHPAAQQRLQIAKALVALASADADADATAGLTAGAASRAAAGKALAAGRRQPKQLHEQGSAAAAGLDPGALLAAVSAATSTPGSSGPQAAPAGLSSSAGQAESRTPGVSSERKLLEQQQQPEAIGTFGEMLQRAAAAASTGVTTRQLGTPGSDQVAADAPQQEQLLQQLTVLLRGQPYKPLQTDVAALESALMHFVHTGPQNRLYVQDQPWLLKGFDVPGALQMAAGGAVPRSQLLYLLDRAQTLGLNTLRFRAFADGAPGVGSAVAAAGSGGQEQVELEDAGSFCKPALQPAPGVLNGTMLREGLDWLVHECGLRAIRLLPVLTNGGSAEGGGMKQYIDWVDPALTVTDFYTNDTIKSVFLDYVAAMLGHVSSLSGLPLREDPIILGWQLAEDASHPGSPSSQSLLAWLRQFGGFIKQRAPRQLLIPGVLDLFGHNSPHHLQYNPHAQVFAPASHSPHTYKPRCHGVDFWLHNQIPQADAAVAGVFPDLAIACNDTCKLGWARDWNRAHMRDAMRMNRPLILGGVGALRPHGWRQQVLQLVQAEVERALQRGHPIGGVIISGLTHPDVPDETGWATYYTAKGVQRARQPLDNLNAQAERDAQWRRFTNYDAFLACQALLTRGVSDDKAEATNKAAWVDGWEDVVRAVAAIGTQSDAGVRRQGAQAARA